MSTLTRIDRRRVGLVVAMLLCVMAGCATTAPPTPRSDGITYREHPHLQQIWLADAFTFKGYDGIVVGETRSEAPNVNPDGLENLKWATGVLREEIVRALREKNAFAAVATGPAEITPGARVLRLDNTIVEYEKGGGGARFFAGLYGAGQPVLRVRGRLLDGDRLVFAYEARRSGDSALARMFGGYRSDKAIQEEDIRDLARDLADFIVENTR